MYLIDELEISKPYHLSLIGIKHVDLIEGVDCEMFFKRKNQHMWNAPTNLDMNGHICCKHK